jgi:4-hydroxy-tetrahydrodipicolinate synthase
VTGTDPVFSGVGVALVTLFDDGGELNAAETAEHAARLVDLGVRAVIVAGSTGEAASLSVEERDVLLDAVREAIDGRVPVIAGTGGPSARQAAELTRRACDGGADAVLALSPPGSANLHRYYEEVAEAAGGLPVLGYHFPLASAPGIPVDELPDLPIQGVKDSSGDPERLLEELGAIVCPLYVGSSALLSLAGPRGCAGAILAVANVQPELCAAAFAGDAGAQRELGPAHLAARVDFPRGLKEEVSARFGTSPVSRMG